MTYCGSEDYMALTLVTQKVSEFIAHSGGRLGIEARGSSEEVIFIAHRVAQACEKQSSEESSKCLAGAKKVQAHFEASARQPLQLADAQWFVRGLEMLRPRFGEPSVDDVSARHEGRAQMPGMSRPQGGCQAEHADSPPAAPRISSEASAMAAQIQRLDSTLIPLSGQISEMHSILMAQEARIRDSSGSSSHFEELRNEVSNRLQALDEADQIRQKSTLERFERIENALERIEATVRPDTDVAQRILQMREEIVRGVERGGDAGRLLENILFDLDSLVEILSIVSFEPSEGAEYRNTEHEVEGWVSSPAPELIERIASCTRPGWRIQGGAVLKKARVQLYSGTV